MDWTLGTLFVYVSRCVFMVTTYLVRKSMDQSGKVSNPARGQLNRKKYMFPLSPFAPENLVARDSFGRRPVLRQPALSSHPD